jgi:uncharacterized protein YbjT (DUF2867 family)
MKHAAIAGASGLIGGLLLNKLLMSNDYETVTALVRKPLSNSNTKLRELTVDFLHLPKTKIDRSEDSNLELFCTLGTTIKAAGSKEAFRLIDHDAILNFAIWGLEQGATRFYLVSSLGADPNSNFFYNKVKGQTERDLKSLGYECLKIFRPSLLLGDRKTRRPVEEFAEKVSSTFSFLFKGNFEKYRPVKAIDVAEAIVASGKTSASGIFESNDIQSIANNLKPETV